MNPGCEGNRRFPLSDAAASSRFRRYNVLLFVMLYCLPVSFNLTIGFLTGRRLWGGRKSTFADLDPRSQALHASRLKMRQKIAKMVVCLVVLFAVSWLPLYLADLWIDHEHSPPPWLLQTRPFAQWLGLTNSSLNPICYCFIGDLYRSARGIRLRYYQKVAALFGTSSFSTTAAPVAVIADSKLASGKQHRIAAAAVAASTSMVPVPRLLRLGGGPALGPSGSVHSISDWCQSGPGVCDGPPLPCQLRPAHQAPPTRRHSVSDDSVALLLRVGSVDTSVLPLRRHSGDRRDVGGARTDARAGPAQRRNKRSRASSPGGQQKDGTDMTSL